MSNRLRFVLPNAVTCVGLVLGLVAISEATRGRYVSSGWFIVLCVLLDKVDGTVAQTRKIPRTIPFVLSFDETFDVGIDTRSGVDDADYSVPFRFTGTLDKLTFKVGPEEFAAK